MSPYLRKKVKFMTINYLIGHPWRTFMLFEKWDSSCNIWMAQSSLKEAEFGVRSGVWQVDSEQSTNPPLCTVPRMRLLVSQGEKGCHLYEGRAEIRGKYRSSPIYKNKWWLELIGFEGQNGEATALTGSEVLLFILIFCIRGCKVILTVKPLCYILIFSLFIFSLQKPKEND
jgi:hypothetical protein